MHVYYLKLIKSIEMTFFSLIFISIQKDFNILLNYLYLRFIVNDKMTLTSMTQKIKNKFIYLNLFMNNIIHKI